MTRSAMADAPKDGRWIIVGDPNVGQFAMYWNAEATNPLFAPAVVGLWENADMTWAEGPGGPTYWLPLARKDVQ